ncbi:MAG: TonB-dependent receptor [Acidobacteria bacterium]|nr:TonB-dependent receptor [Acidobacteriota bacterium]
MRRPSMGCWLFAIALIVGYPAAGLAQEAALTGTVTDTTGGVLPGVTVTAVHEATGNTFEVVTDGTGSFRLPVRVGSYRVTAQLQGFQTVTRTNVQLLLGQQAVVTLELAPATLQETVTVTGEAPLIDTTESTVGANIDPRQMAELPINGRNWMDLALLTPGARRNESGGYVQNRQGYSQTNVDGQQVTTIYHSGGDNEQPQWSRDAIGEFQVVANRFDATQGRSSGMVVNAITKSGTNTFAGTVGGYFRNDQFNSEDFVAHRVLPYSNQQTSGTLGGPIVKDKLHFFGAYEYEREPKTFVYATPYPAFNMDLSFTNRAHKPLGRVDWQITPQTRLWARVSGYNQWFYEGGGSTAHPINMGQRGRITSQYTGSLTQVLSNRAVNEVKGGATYYERRDSSAVATWKGQRPLPYHPVLEGGTVLVSVRGFTIGTSPLNIIQNTANVRDDFTTSYEFHGRHDVKIGGEYMRFFNDFRWCLRCMGSIDATGGNAPSAAALQTMFPVWNDASTWNLQPLLPITRFVQHSLTSTEHTYDVTRNLASGWVQDDWRASDRLTLNLGVRWDWDSNGNNEDLKFLPWVSGTQTPPMANLAPRLGVNFRLDDSTVVRGGYGVFFAFQPNDGVQQTQGYLCSTDANYCARFENQINPDGRADFVPNWFGPGASREGEWGGPKPTGLEAVARACDVNHSAPGCVYRSLTQEVNYEGRPPQYAHQAGIGVQRQLAQAMAFEANFNYTGGRREEVAVNGNLSYNPATGANNPFNAVNLRPFPDWGIVNFEWLAGESNYYGTDFSLTKRYADNWQATASYTLAYFKDQFPRRQQWVIGSDGLVTRQPIGFALSRDMGGDYTYAESDQRHRFTANGIWDVARGFQVSGIYFYGSGERRAVTTGVDRRNEASLSEQRLRADGSIVPRNSLVGQPIHRVDMRLQQRVPLPGTLRLDGMFEVFNLFNHANYGSYTTNESNALFGQPSFNSNIAYWPRVFQLGIRLAF